MAEKRESGGWRTRHTVMTGIAAVVLLHPLVATDFVEGVNWTPSDYVFAGAMLTAVFVPFELAARSSAGLSYKAGVGVALIAGFLLIWINAAVGMIRSEENSYNLLFVGVIFLALLGSAVAGFRARGMALAMAAAATAQASLGIVGAFADLRGGAFSTMFAGLWLLSAALLSAAARETRRA